MCGRGHSGVSRSKPACPRAMVEAKEKAVVVGQVLVCRGIGPNTCNQFSQCTVSANVRRFQTSSIDCCYNCIIVSEAVQSYGSLRHT